MAPRSQLKRSDDRSLCRDENASSLPAKQAKHTKRICVHARERPGFGIQQEVTEKTEDRVRLRSLRWLLFKSPALLAAERPNIGLPQLFTGAEPSPWKSSAKATVNNCAGAHAPQQDSDGIQDSFALSASSVFPPRRARSANDQSLDDFELIDRPAGRGLAL